jgi:hypothetical protein
MQPLKPLFSGMLTRISLASMLGAALTLTSAAPSAQTPPADAARNASPEAGSDFRPSASIAEIMKSIVEPSADAIWNSVAIETTNEGSATKGPGTDEDWQKLRRDAVALAEITNNLIIPGRVVSRPGGISDYPDLNRMAIEQRIAKNWNAWVGHAHTLHAVALQAVQIIDKRDVEQLSAIGNALDDSCVACHTEFWYPDQK